MTRRYCKCSVSKLESRTAVSAVRPSRRDAASARRRRRFRDGCHEISSYRACSWALMGTPSVDLLGGHSPSMQPPSDDDGPTGSCGKQKKGREPRPHLSRISAARQSGVAVTGKATPAHFRVLSLRSEIRNRAIRAHMARRVLGATSLLFHPRDAVLVSYSDPLGASLQKTGAGSFGKQSILRTPGAARRARMLCGTFSVISLQGVGGVVRQSGKLTMRSLLILVAICCSGSAFAQGTPPKVGNKPLVQVKPKEPMGCKFVGTVRGTKLWAGDCVGSELRGSTTTTEKPALPEQATGAITADQKD